MIRVSEPYREYDVEAVPIGGMWHAKLYARQVGLPLQPTTGGRFSQRLGSADGALRVARLWVDELLATTARAPV
jgi:hypothetical protein